MAPLLDVVGVSTAAILTSKPPTPRGEATVQSVAVSALVGGDTCIRVRPVLGLGAAL